MEKEHITGFTAKKAKDGRPRILIRDVPAHIGNIIDSLLISSPEINTILDASQEDYRKCITSLPTKVPQCKDGVIETSPILYKNIMKTGQVKIGMCIYRITDHVHIIKCQRMPKSTRTNMRHMWRRTLY